MVTIPPVLVLSTGRCGSTMISNLLNRHPGVLSLSEFFSFIGIGSFRRRHPSGDWMWDLYGRQRKRTRLMLRECYEELLYPIDDPGARFTRHDLPPILCATLPHITDRYEALFDELEPIVRGQPGQPPVDHFRHLFEWLCGRFDHRVWAERSGGSLLFASHLLREFPEARVIHVYRDGRETAISMSRHYLFRMIVATIRALRSLGIDLLSSMSRGEHWDRISPWMEPLVSTFFDPARLPYDKLTLADFGVFWSGMIERGHRLFGPLPPERLLDVRFEDVQREPEAQIQRLIRFIDPSLEDDAWLREAVLIPRPSSSKFRRLEAGERAVLTEACRPGLERLGYPL